MVARNLYVKSDYAQQCKVHAEDNPAANFNCLLGKWEDIISVCRWHYIVCNKSGLQLALFVLQQHSKWNKMDIKS